MKRPEVECPSAEEHMRVARGVISQVGAEDLTSIAGVLSIAQVHATLAVAEQLDGIRKALLWVHT